MIESGDAREVHHCALLLGYGAGVVNPYLAFESLDDLIRQLKQRKDKTILLVEHKMDVVRELADRVIVLHNGQLLADGEPAEVMGLPIVQSAYMGTAVFEEAA